LSSYSKHFVPEKYLPVKEVIASFTEEGNHLLTFPSLREARKVRYLLLDYLHHRKSDRYIFGITISHPFPLLCNGGKGATEATESYRINVKVRRGREDEIRGDGKEVQ